MKKLLTILTITLFLSVAAFASSNEVKINGNVAEDAYALKLYYGSSSTSLTLINDNNFVVKNGDNPFDLTQKGNTQNFSIRLNGNQNTAPVLDISTVVTPFKPTDTTKTYKETDEVAVEKYDEVTPAVGAGYHSGTIVKQFALRWDGNKQLTAGSYQSTVTINYSVQ